MQLLAGIFLSFSLFSPSVYAQALSQDDQNSIYSDTVWYDTSSSLACGSDITQTSGGSSGGSHSLDQVKTFAATPIASTWNISDSTVEQWFLKQAGAQPVITRYGLNSSNIGQITSAIKAAKVSPVYFYLYTVNEGGAGSHNYGFINQTDRSGLSGVAAASADAQYLADHSKIMNSTPSWIDAAYPQYDFVPQAVKNAGNADFQNMPSGTIGRAGIPASAATTWEVYYPNGLKKAYNHVQDYGPPLENDMQNIQTMGGNPLQGGATISTGGCTPGGVAGQGIAKAINWAVMIAKNDGYGYDQPTRTSGWAKWQSDPSCTHQCGSFDCSSFVAAALTEAGYFKTNPEFSTFSEASYLGSAGFAKVASSATSSANLKPGDILLLTVDHTAMYIGNNQVVQASINENGGVSGGQVGDQTGQEIWVTQFYNDGWDGVFRAPS